MANYRKKGFNIKTVLPFVFFAVGVMLGDKYNPLEKIPILNKIFI